MMQEQSIANPAAIGRYFTALRKLIKWNNGTGDYIMPFISPNFGPEYFKAPMLRELIALTIGSVIGDCELVCEKMLQFFLDEFDLRDIRNVLIDDIFLNPYILSPFCKSNKLETLDQIAAIFIPGFKKNMEIRLLYIMHNSFKSGYKTETNFWNEMSGHGATIDIFKHVTYLGTEMVISNEYAAMEKYISTTIKTLARSPGIYVEFPLGISVLPSNDSGFISQSEMYDSGQGAAIRNCLNNRVAVITGRPGTGKSHIIGILLKYAKLISIQAIALAPTGVAVDNIFSRFGGTCYTLCKFKQLLKSGFINSKFSMYKPTLIIIDEFSMVDMFIFYKILKSLEFRSRFSLVLIGDPDQLPSIKAGQLLEDIMKMPEIRHWELKHCYRNNSDIQTVLDGILRGYFRLGTVKSIERFEYKNVNSLMRFNLSDKLNRSNQSNETDEPNRIDLSARMNLFTSFKPRSVAVLSPTNTVVDQINTAIQKQNPGKILFPENPSKGSFYTLKEGDKVIFQKNMPAYNLYNGTILYIKKVVFHHERHLVVITFNWDEVITENDRIGDRTFECKPTEVRQYIRLCYAMTIHKSQSAEFDKVFLIMRDYPAIMHDRRLLYTALSRARNKCYIAGDFQVLDRSCRIKKSRPSSII